MPEFPRGQKRLPNKWCTVPLRNAFGMALLFGQPTGLFLPPPEFLAGIRFLFGLLRLVSLLVRVGLLYELVDNVAVVEEVGKSLVVVDSRDDVREKPRDVRRDEPFLVLQIRMVYCVCTDYAVEEAVFVCLVEKLDCIACEEWK